MLALQNFQSAMQGDDSLFASEYRGLAGSRAGMGADLQRKCFFGLSREKEFGRNRGLYFSDSKTDRVIEGRGVGREVLDGETVPGFKPGRGIESGSSFRGNLNSKLWAIRRIKPPALGAGLGPFAASRLLFTSRHLRQTDSQKNS